MKKITECGIGDMVICVRNEKTAQIIQVNDDNMIIKWTDDNTEKTLKLSNLKRWYKYVEVPVVEVEQQVIEVEQVEQVIVVEEQVEQIIEPVQPTQPVTVNSNITLSSILELASSLGCIVKQCTNHYAIKFNNKKVMEVYVLRNSIKIVTRTSNYYPERVDEIVEQQQGVFCNYHPLNLKFTPLNVADVKTHLELAIHFI